LAGHDFAEFFRRNFYIADLHFIGAGRLLLLTFLLTFLLSRLSSGGRFPGIARRTMAAGVRILRRPLLLVLGLPIELVEGLAVAGRRRTARLLAAARL
jgi:hypothetical protein